jgi:hypothetical protein
MNKICIAWMGVVVACLGFSCQSRQDGTVGVGFRGPINASGGTSPTTVLIVPTNESDGAAQQKIHEYVHGIRKFVIERSPGREVKIMADSEALADGLADSAVSVYGTPQGNLWLAKYMGQLPVVIEPNRITTDRVHDGSDLRFVTAWPHPSNPKLGMVVYTAQRAQDVVGINSVFHGPTDYVVAQGQTILQSGSYSGKDGTWTFGGDLSLPQTTEDLEFLFTTVEQVHPNHLANLSKEQYRQLKQDSQAALAAAPQEKGRIPRSVLGLTVARAAASLGDGHTSCWLGWDLFEADESGVCMPPFRLKWQAGQVVIDRTILGLEHLKGACLSEIDSKPFAEAVAPILTYVSGERQAFRMIRFLNNQDLYWALVRPIEGREMTVTVRRDMNDSRTITVPLISRTQYKRELPVVLDICPTGRTEYHHGGRSCYWRFDNFHVGEVAEKAIDNVFKDIRERQACNLIIDLRFNGGGNSRGAEYILNYLTSERYRIFSRVDVKVSRQFAKAQRLGILGPLSWFSMGRVVGMNQSPRRPRDMGYRFDGCIYVIVGPGTFSTAADFSHIVKDYRLGTLVGEETGGIRLCFGDRPDFSMPHSNMQFGVSMKRFHAPIPAPDDATRGSVPDVPIREEDLARFAGCADPELAFVLDLIERRDEEELKR